MRDKSKFQNFGSGITFTCRVCHRKTRQAGQGIGIELCPECYEIAGLDNMVNDNGYEPGSKEYASARAECDALLAKAVKQGSDGERIKDTNSYIWREEEKPKAGARQMRLDAARKEQREACKINHDDFDAIPAFLCKVCNPSLAKPWTPQPKKDDPQTVSNERAHRAAELKREAERLKKEELEKHREEKKKALPKIDTTGKRWDPRKSKWVDDPLDKLCKSAEKEQPKVVVPLKKASPKIPEGTNRAKLANAMMKRVGKMIPLAEWAQAVYGDKTKEGACAMVIKGFIVDLAKQKLPFEIIQDKNANGQKTFGIYPINKE